MQTLQNRQTLAVCYNLSAAASNMKLTHRHMFVYHLYIIVGYYYHYTTTTTVLKPLTVRYQIY